MELVSEIAVKRCVINPDVGGDFCYPDSTSEEDAIKGKWVLVPRNLNFEGGYMSGWLVRNYSHPSRWVYGLTLCVEHLLPSDKAAGYQSNYGCSTLFRTRKTILFRRLAQDFHVRESWARRTPTSSPVVQAWEDGK